MKYTVLQKPSKKKKVANFNLPRLVNCEGGVPLNRADKPAAPPARLLSINDVRLHHVSLPTKNGDGSMGFDERM
jgi:hypothetical protein